MENVNYVKQAERPVPPHRMKRHTLIICVFLVFCLLLPVQGSARRLPETIIKVGVIIEAKSFNMSSQGKYYIYDLNSGKQYDIASMNDYLVRPKTGGIVIDGRKYGAFIRLIPKESAGYLRISGRRYRDNIIIRMQNGKLTVINELGLEDYLFGILPREVNPAWPMEALKAQAVVSRTYVLRNLRKHAKNGFDVCTETHCQVYGGVESENKTTNEAVLATRSEVQVYNGELAQTLFHASCGGYTENPNYVWSWDSSSPDYLCGVMDKYCRNSPHQFWQNKLSAELIRQKLSKANYAVGKIVRITLTGNDGSGRPEKLKIKHSDGTLVIAPSKFRMAVDPWLVKSAMITNVSRSGGNFIIEGRGWGHGVGLCQWGAKELGEKGYSYKKILIFYYPGTKTEKWEE